MRSLQKSWLAAFLMEYVPGIAAGRLLSAGAEAQGKSQLATQLGEPNLVDRVEEKPRFLSPSQPFFERCLRSNFEGSTEIVVDILDTDEEPWFALADQSLGCSLQLIGLTRARFRQYHNAILTEKIIPALVLAPSEA